jgi:hypothetical protein
MQTLTKSVKVLFKAERILARERLFHEVFKSQFKALAVLIAIIGVVMLSISLFFALSTPFGNAVAALIVGVSNFALAAMILFAASSMKPSRTYDMAQTIRDGAIDDIETDVQEIADELKAVRADIHALVHRPPAALVPSMVVPAVEAALKGLNANHAPGN